MPTLPSLSSLRALPHPGTRPELVEAVFRGLKDGSLYQTGGVVRRAVPSMARGRIFAHLYQHGVAPLEQAVDWGPKLSQGLGQLQGLVTVSTALSVVNLGVSVVGFAILARKIDRVEKSVKLLEGAVQAGFEGVGRHLDRIEAQVVGLSALVEGGQVRAEAKLDALRGQIDWTVISRLMASAESLSEIEGGRRAGRDAGEHAERIRECRIYLSGTVSEALSNWRGKSPDADLLRTRALVMALAQAIAAEAAAWRLAGESVVAARTAADAVPLLQTQARAVMLPFLGGDSAVLGGSMRTALPDCSPLAALTPAFLSGDAAHDRPGLERTLSSRWAVYLGEHPSQARAALRNPQALDSRIGSAIGLARPLAHAVDVIDGMSAEYAALAESGAGHAEWERSQVPSGSDAVLIIRDIT